MKADWKAALRRLEVEDWGLLALLFLLVVGLALVAPGWRCLACGLGVPEAAALLGTPWPRASPPSSPSPSP